MKKKNGNKTNAGRFPLTEILSTHFIEQNNQHVQAVTGANCSNSAHELSHQKLHCLSKQ